MTDIKEITHINELPKDIVYQMYQASNVTDCLDSFFKYFKREPNQVYVINQPATKTGTAQVTVFCVVGVKP